jgi:NitT/TauT family transport system permease protein
MSRLSLLVLQILVAVAAVALWHVLTTYPVFGKILLPPFFFSNPVDVASQIVVWFATGVIWKHLWVTLIESILAFVIGSIGGVLVGFWFARQPRTAAVFDPYVQAVNALPRVVLAHIFTLWLGLGIWSRWRSASRWCSSSCSSTSTRASRKSARRCWPMPACSA